MLSVVFIFILVFIYLDGRMFRRRDEELYRRHFRLRGWTLPVWCGILLIFFFLPDGLEYLAAVFFIFGLPVYLSARRRLEGNLHSRQPLLTPDNDTLPLVSDTIGVILYWFLGMVLVEVVIKLVLEPFISELAKTLVVSVFSFIWVVFLVERMARSYPHISLKGILGLKRRDISAWRLWLLPALLGIAAAAVSSYIIHSRPFQPITPLTDLIDSTRSAGVIFFFLILAVLMAPFFEEALFRGFFFYVLQKFKGTAAAVAVITFIFGAMHVRQYWQDWAAILVVMVLGFILTGLRAWTGSSIPGMVTHYIYNFVMAVVPVVILLISNPSYYEFQARLPELTFSQKEELLLKSMEENPRHAASYNDLAWVYVEEGKNLDEALRLVDKALELDPNRFQLLDTKAEILYRMGRIEEAVAIAEDLVERLPKSGYAQEQLEKFRSALPEEAGADQDW